MNLVIVEKEHIAPLQGVAVLIHESVHLAAQEQEDFVMVVDMKIPGRGNRRIADPRQNIAIEHLIIVSIFHTNGHPSDSSQETQ
ncbi:hypothetical protein D3C71_1993470 [compost metagenome]